MTNILVVSARFYTEISSELEAGALRELAAKGATHEIVYVPGAFEIPGVIRFALESKKYEGFVALGCVIRGETTHYDYVCGESARGLMDLTLEHNAAIGYGILTVENEEQAWVRADMTQGNKGSDAVIACLRMIELKQHFGVGAK
ncbi:MAG: 6,7-dimethyl-8-ribityllumazine synthase [Alphaproteobacteria bacterium]|nr:6,7-dimethyl-8-ribityllumazine synthase [Alphaproteobacteria bacterium]